MPSQPPYCCALQICDGIQVDPGNGKITVLGTYDELRPTRYPAGISRLFVFAELSGGRGPCSLHVELVSPGTGMTDRVLLGRSGMEVVFSDPSRTVPMYFEFEDLVLPRPGGYAFVLTAGGAYVAERTLQLRRLRHELH